MSAGLFLQFDRWECGHHQMRPADIPVASAEQALLICRAIAAAVSQPGGAHAFLVSEETAESIYISDDSVSVGWTSGTEFGSEHSWPDRPIVYFGSAEEQEKLHSPALSEALDYWGPELERWDGTSLLDSYVVVTTTKTLAELEAAAIPPDWHDQRKRLFELPPVFKPMGPLIEELNRVAADIAEEEGGTS